MGNMQILPASGCAQDGAGVKSRKKRPSFPNDEPLQVSNRVGIGMNYAII